MRERRSGKERGLEGVRETECVRDRNVDRKRAIKKG
jgi:hypothetical protein